MEFASRRAGGPFESVRALAMELQRQGLAEVKVVARRDDLAETDRGAWGTLDLVHVEPAGWRGVITGRDVADACLKASVDLIHVHNLWTCTERAVVNLSRRGAGIPYVVSPRGTLAPWAFTFKRWKKRLSWPIWEARLFDRTACVHALSLSEAAEIRNAGIKRAICIIPNGVAIPGPFPPRVPRRQRRLLFLGRLHPKKGVPELISAWAGISPAIRRGWELVVAGFDDGGYEAGYKKIAAKLVTDESIIFPGGAFGEDKRKLLSTVDAFILPSHSEGVPMAVLEAWSFGLPVVMTAACNLSIGFARGAAVRIEPHADSIAAVLDEFLTRSDDALEAMGQAGRQLVEERFTWQWIAAEMSAVYRWILGGERPSSVILP